MKEKNKDKTLSLAVTNDLFVRVIADKKHEFLMTTRQVALGYGASYGAVRVTKTRHSDELIEGVHFIQAVAKCNTPANNASIYWTKAGIIRLGFFIKSSQAKLFRDWAERLILKLDEQLDLFGNTIPTAPKKAISKPYNPMTRKNIMAIMADVCEIENKELRMRIINKLVGEGVIS